MGKQEEKKSQPATSTKATTTPVAGTKPTELRSVVSKDLQEPVQKQLGMKQTYYDLFKKTYDNLHPKEPMKGDPTDKLANGHPTLVKYYQNWLKA